MLALNLLYLAILAFFPRLDEVDDVLLENTSFFASSLYLSKVDFVLTCPHLHCC